MVKKKATKELEAVDSRTVSQRDSFIFIKWTYNVIKDDFDLTEYQQVDYTGVNKVKDLTKFFYQELRSMDIVRLADYSLLIFKVREYPDKPTWDDKKDKGDLDFLPIQKVILFDDVNQDIRFLSNQNLQFMDQISSY